jgi:hypothetical protein
MTVDVFRLDTIIAYRASNHSAVLYSEQLQGPYVKQAKIFHVKHARTQDHSTVCGDAPNRDELG